MTDTGSFQEERQALYQQHTRDLLHKVKALKDRAQRGRYDDDDLRELANILKSIRYDIVGNDTRLSEVIGLPGRTIANTYGGKSRPKYHNFMKMLHGAGQLLEKENRTSKAVSFQIDDAEPQSDQVRIRAKHSSIFLNETDLVRVQKIAEDSNTSISTVIGRALNEYEQLQTSNLSGPSQSPPAELAIIRNRSEIVRYSTAIIVALEEALNYDVSRHHNLPPPDLRIDDPSYLKDIRKLVVELRRMNVLLARPSETSARAALQKANRFGKTFETFLSSYASALGKGAAALTIAAAVGLLYQAGIGREVIDLIWEHTKTIPSLPD